MIWKLRVYEEEPGRRSAAKLLTKDEDAADRGQHGELPELVTKTKIGQFACGK